jgi:prolyl-tRNA synthetase
MRRSDLFLPATREPRGAHEGTTGLLVRAGLVREFGSGLWGLTPAGRRVREKVVGRLRAAVRAAGGQEVDLPGLQYRDPWERSGRWATFEGEMFTLTNRDDQEMCLAPSHEEGVVHMADGLVRSHRDLPLVLFQVDAKFRDDRARGLVRSKEFTMTDAYSLHLDAEGLRETYRAVRGAFADALADLGLTFAVVPADNGAMGGDRSEEFVAPVPDGEGSVRLVHCPADGCRFGRTDEHDGFGAVGAGADCPDCGAALAADEGTEVAHVFELGTRYSAAMGLTVDDDAGRAREVEMGSYGVGVERLVATLAAQHAGDDGLRWPVTSWGSVAPYRAAVVSVGGDEARSVVEEIHAAVGADCLLYDGDLSTGERFAESALLGVPATVVVGNRYRETGLVDVETAEGTEGVAPEAVPERLERFAAGGG